MTREEYRRTVKSGGMYATRDVYGNPRFIIHFLDLVHEDHPGDHCDKMESARRISHALLNKKWSEIGDWASTTSRHSKN